MPELTAGLVGVLGIILLFLLLASGMPVAFVMALVGLLGFSLLAGWKAGLTLLGLVPYTTSGSVLLMALPMFILMGEFAFYAGMTTNLFEATSKWLVHLRGGLAHATIGACALFAAISGSSVATAATMGTVALPEMRRRKYDVKLATGAIAAGGTMGILIPPSNVFVIYGLITETSIGKLFMAGVIPGILQAISYMIVIFVMTRLNPSVAPPSVNYSWREKVNSLSSVWGVGALFLLVVGGLYAGIFTATEAAAVGAFGTFLLMLVNRKATPQNILASLGATAKSACMIITIIIGAYIFSYFLAITQLPNNLSTWIMELGLPRYAVVALIFGLYLVLGCFMDGAAMMVLTLPILFPLVVGLGFDPVWFGVIVVRSVEIGNITPPFALNVFVLKSVAKDIPMEQIYRGIIPFLLADIPMVALLMAFPQIALFLPGLMTG